MCGIAGYWSNTKYVNKEMLIDMGQLIKHRGPDFTGIYNNNYCGLVHNRLSIIDLSDSANQPIVSANGRYIMIYNGEVYNYKTLASQFGISCKTNSDTEVVLELYIKIGINFLSKLNGMFALAIYDTIDNRLLVARDRVGIKPLYYSNSESKFIFSSELKTITKNIKNKEINTNAVSEFFHMGFISAPNTIYSNIKKLPQGHFAIIDNTGLHIKKWWDVESKILRQTKFKVKEAVNQLDRLINDSVKMRLVSDVPVGTFLSGGIDSSLVSAIAAKHFNGKIKSFTIGFDNSKFNEAQFAEKIAKHIGSNHELLYVSDKDARELLPTLITQFDEPFADTSAIPTMMVSKLAKENVTVALSGDGGDELFMGYGSYNWANRLSNIPFNIIKPTLRQAFKIGNSRLRRISKILERNNNIITHIFSQEQYLFTNREITKLLLANNNPFTPIFNKLRVNLSPSETQALFDFKHYLPDDLLTKVDRASMMHSLEVRVPLLDHRIVEFAFNLPQKYRLNGSSSKFLLKEVLYKYIPKEYFNRPKQGFSVPLHQWMQNDLKDWFETFLSQDMIKKHGYLNQDYVSNIRNAFQKNSNKYLYNRIWTIAAFHAWLNEQ